MLIKGSTGIASKKMGTIQKFATLAKIRVTRSFADDTDSSLIRRMGRHCFSRLTSIGTPRLTESKTGE